MIDALNLTQEQLDAIAELLRPPCCHVSGTHDPRHFLDGKYVCHDQKAKAYDRFREAIGIEKVALDDCVSVAQCYWCASERKKEGILS